MHGLVLGLIETVVFFQIDDVFGGSSGSAGVNGKANGNSASAPQLNRVRTLHLIQ